MNRRSFIKRITATAACLALPFKIKTSPVIPDTVGYPYNLELDTIVSGVIEGKCDLKLDENHNTIRVRRPVKFIKT